MDQMEQLKHLSFLDVNTGLSYCGGSMEFYREMLTAFVENSRLQGLLTAFDSKDLNAFRVDIHALKSASLTIGAVDLSNQCRLLEHAAKNWELSYIREHTGETMEDYQQVMQGIRQVLKESCQQSGESAAPASQASFRRDADILIVDDDMINLKVAESILKEGFTTDCVSSGREALSYLETASPRLILLDLHMPDMSGFEVLKAIREMEKAKEIPVVFLTADKDTESEIESFRLGAMDFITKPFVREIMLRRVSRILEYDRLKKNLQQEVDRQTRKAMDRKRKLERITHQVIQALAGTVDAKDRYTNGHSMRVAKYAGEIAMRMGMSRQDQENIYYTGMLHDIGKIGVPDEIINKPGRLTDEEFAVIKTHPVIGSEILKNISEIPGLYLGTRGHHERYDGKGYPDGLKGEEIPIQARIIAVADAYDAMTSHRSYRSLLPQDVVRREIEEGKGVQFDPRIADIMLEMIDGDVAYTMHE